MPKGKVEGGQAAAANLLRSKLEGHKLFKDAREVIARKLSPEKINTLLEKFQHPFIEKVTLIERRASTDGTEARLESFAQTLKRNKPSDERENYIMRLDQILQVSHNLAYTASQFKLAAGLALRKVGAIQGDLSKRGTEWTRRKDELKTLAAMKKRMRVSLLYTYRELTDDELKRYLDFVSQPELREYYRATYEGLKTAFTNLTDSLR